MAIIGVPGVVSRRGEGLFLLQSDDLRGEVRGAPSNKVEQAESEEGSEDGHHDKRWPGARQDKAGVRGELVDGPGHQVEC